MQKQALPLCRMAVLSVNWAASIPSGSPISCLWPSSATKVAFSTVVERSNETLELQYQNGLPRLRIPLPSRRESCQFTLKPLSHSVADFSRFIRQEDGGIDRVAFYTNDGIRIASSDSIESLLRGNFDLEINDQLFTVTVPDTVDSTHETVDRLNEVRTLVSQLHMELNVEEHELYREKELKTRLHTLLQDLEPLEKERLSLADAASKRTQFWTWAALAGMSIQFGVLARLTWWEYSWDIMEPVTYFVGTGTAILCFAYYVLTKQEYCYPQVYDRVYLTKFYNDARKKSFDVEKYNELRNSIALVESDLSRLRDPLLMKLPLQQRDAVLPNQPHPADLRRDP